MWIKTFIINTRPQTTSSWNCFAWQLVFLVFPRWDCPADEPAPCRYSYCLWTPEVCQTGPATVWTSPGSLLWHPEEKHRAVQQLCFPLCLSSLQSTSAHLCHTLKVYYHTNCTQHGVTSTHFVVPFLPHFYYLFLLEYVVKKNLKMNKGNKMVVHKVKFSCPATATHNNLFQNMGWDFKLLLFIGWPFWFIKRAEQRNSVFQLYKA